MSASDELLRFLSDALGAPPSADVLSALAAQEVADKATLLECWEEVKESLPGAPRKRIGDKVALATCVKIESMDFAPVWAPTVWIFGFVVAIITLAPAIAVGYSKEHDAPEEGEEDLSTHLWWRCWVPAIVLGIGEIAASGYLAPKIGYDMIQEHSVGCDLREAMKNNMTNQGVVSALFLTVVWAMLQADVLWDDADRVVAQWYNALLVISIALTILGACISSMCLMYAQRESGTRNLLTPRAQLSWETDRSHLAAGTSSRSTRRPHCSAWATTSCTSASRWRAAPSASSTRSSRRSCGSSGSTGSALAPFPSSSSSTRSRAASSCTSTSACGRTPMSTTRRAPRSSRRSPRPRARLSRCPRWHGIAFLA
jgi:hypothetical protein